MEHLRLAVDTGGTFTDLVIQSRGGELRIFKAPTTPDDPVRGILDVLQVASRELEVPREQLLGATDVLIHGTTRALNAVLTGTTARTALLTTQGHPDILVFREGGRTRPFDFTRAYPAPYVSRSLTFEIPERIDASGEIVLALDEGATRAVLTQVAEAHVEAIAICLLWSLANPAHELRVGELVSAELPYIPFTLSHALNPTIREYRRSSSAAIDASLKPVMTAYLSSLEQRLREAGFAGRLLIVSSIGGVLDSGAVAAAPIHALGSGPAMAPVAGRHYARVDAQAVTAVIADTGGTSYDVSLVRRGRIPWTREAWLGEPYLGHMTGFPSVDVKSIGAGGGSIAWVDDGGLLHVGPRSAGADPGPVCYGRGGTEPTVTDAAVLLGYLDPEFFLGGAMTLDVGAAAVSVTSQVADRLEMNTQAASAAILQVATEHMVRAIEEITLNQGIDPRDAALVGGGGAAGLNVVAIARRLGCPVVVIPEVGAVLSAAGALMSPLTAEYARTHKTTSADFDFEGVATVLRELRERCQDFISGPGANAEASRITFSVEARYPHQIWELEVQLQSHSALCSAAEICELEESFHQAHEEMFAISDPSSHVEFIGWRARVECPLGRATQPGLVYHGDAVPSTSLGTRAAYFQEYGVVEAKVVTIGGMDSSDCIEGPAIIESPVTTIVIEPGAGAVRTASGSVLVTPWLTAIKEAQQNSGERSVQT